MSPRTITPAALVTFAIDVLTSAGADHASAEATAAALLHASLHGVDSHGIRLIPWYADGLRAGSVKGKPVITVSTPRRAAAQVHADGGLGHLPAYRAMDEACTIARDCGIGMAGVIHATHYGAAGTYALAAAEAGFIGFVTSNCTALVVPHGGASPMHGTNPIALAAPRQAGEPFLLDMATSSIPWNRVLNSRTEGLELQPDAALDATGAFTRDATAATMLGPLGGALFGHKGAGLAGLADILGGVLTGMRISTGQDPKAPCDTELGFFMMAIDPATFVAVEVFFAGMDRYFAAMAARSTPERPVYVAGGPQWIARREREAHGIPIANGLHHALAEAAAKAGVPTLRYR